MHGPGLVGLFFTLGYAACSDDSSTGGGGSGGTGGGNAAAQPLAPPEFGVQLATDPVALAAGEETYRCFTFPLPDDVPFPLVGIETQADSSAVHHFGLFNDYALGGERAFDCQEMGAAWGLVSGGGIGTPAVRFPEGTAMTLAQGAKLVVQLHLLNVTSEELVVPPVFINLEAAEDTTGLLPVGLLITGTLDITLPPLSSDVSVEGSCVLTEPLEHVFAAFPHMHQLGKRITTSLTPAASATETMLSDIPWDFGDQGIYPVDGAAQVGDTITTRCNFDNPLDREVSFGLHTDDEMCVNVLYYYPASKPSDYCGIQ